MGFLLLVQCGTGRFHPGVGFKFFGHFADANSQSGGHALLLQQVPQGEGFAEASGSRNSVVGAGFDHTAGDLHNLCRGAIFYWGWSERQMFL